MYSNIPIHLCFAEYWKCCWDIQSIHWGLQMEYTYILLKELN